MCWRKMVMFIYPVCGCVCARDKKRRWVCGWVGVFVVLVCKRERGCAREGA